MSFNEGVSWELGSKQFPGHRSGSSIEDRSVEVQIGQDIIWWGIWNIARGAVGPGSILNSFTATVNFKTHKQPV
jgi:hypothetical protein